MITTVGDEKIAGRISSDTGRVVEATDMFAVAVADHILFSSFQWALIHIIRPLKENTH